MTVKKQLISTTEHPMPDHFIKFNQKVEEDKKAKQIAQSCLLILKKVYNIHIN